jgi:phage tail protein X
MRAYRTKDGDMVDEICVAEYGTEAMTELVYEANPGLAARGPILPKGIYITLPNQIEAKVKSPIRLWS